MPLLAATARGVSCSSQQHRREVEAAEHLERAAAEVTTGGTKLGRHLHGSWLAAIHRHVGDRQAVGRRDAFLESLPCPRESVECFKRRGRLLVRRADKGGRSDGRSY